MSKISDLENKIDALERNVGMLANEAGLDDCLMISDFSSIRKYRDGIEFECETIKKDKGAFNIRERKTALVINKTHIYEYDGTAIYDMHIPPIPVIWKGDWLVNGGVIRAMTVSDIKKFFRDNGFPEGFNIVQDINHMSDIYLTY